MRQGETPVRDKTKPHQHTDDHEIIDDRQEMFFVTEVTNEYEYHTEKEGGSEHQAQTEIIDSENYTMQNESKNTGVDLKGS